MSEVDWNDPASRLSYLERVGSLIYNAALLRHREKIVIDVVNGHAIRPTRTARFGTLFSAGDTGSAFATESEARQHASSCSKGPTKEG